MSFLNPGFIGALALVAIPLIIHLLRRRKLKVIRWAAMDFLRQSQKKQSRRLRIEEIILLILRMLIVAIAVLAFARPVLRALGVPLLSQNARVHTIIVLDNSFSMGYRGPDGKTSWERAQAAANDILTNILKPGDSASLVLLSNKPEALVNAPSYDLKLVQQRVRAAKLSDHASDYLAGAQLVNRMLKAAQTPAKEVYWLSDDQSNAWTTSKKDSARPVWQEIGKQARVAWVSVGTPDGQRDNLMVETPTLSRELVTPQLPVRIETRLVNYGAKPRKDLLVHLFLDGKEQTSDRVSVDPGKAEIVSFPLTRMVKMGTRAGQVKIDDAEHADNLPRDNTSAFAVRVRERIKVLVQDPRPTSNPAKSESFYLLTAMAPSGAAESLAPKLREGENLSSANLRDFDAVVIAGATGLSAGDRRALTDYVKAGGGLLIFPGPNTDAKRLNSDLKAAELQPATLGAKRVFQDEEALTLNPASIANPILTIFKDTSAMNLGTARFTVTYLLEPESDANDPNAVQTLIRFSNGDPALVERTVGLGKVMIAASGAGTTWNQLPLKTSYVPLVYQLLSYLGRGPTSRRNLQQDEPLFLTLPLTDANKSVRVKSPDGTTKAQNSTLDSRGVTFSYASTSQAGLYEATVQESKTQDAFAVGLPAEESDLAYADPKQAVPQAGVATNKLVVADSPAQLQTTVRRSRYGAEVWRSLIWLLLPLLFLESWLAQRFGRRG